MKSEFWAIWSSVIPISNSSPRSGRQEGSISLMDELFGRVGLVGVKYADCVGGRID